jgi:integrase
VARPNRPHWHRIRKKWRARVDGVEYFHPTLQAHQEAEAWAWLAEIKQGVQTLAEASSIPLVSVRGLCERYLAWLAIELDAGRISRHDFGCYLTHLRFFVGHYGDLAAQRLTRDHLADFMAWAEGRNKADYRRDLHKGIKAVMNWVVSEDRRVSALRAPLQDRDVPSKTIRRFFRMCWADARSQRRDRRRDGKMVVLLLRLVLLSGARLGDLCQAKWSDVNWEAGTVVLTPEWYKPGHETDGVRVLYLDRRALRLLISSFHD